MLKGGLPGRKSEDRERELKEEQDDESKRLAQDDIEEVMLGEFGLHRVVDEEEVHYESFKIFMNSHTYTFC